MSKWVSCRHCGHTYSNEIKECPKCFAKTPITFTLFLKCSIASALVVAVISLAILGFFDNGDEVPLDSSENYSKQNYSSTESTNSTAFSESPENETKLAESNISSGVYTHTLDNSDILNYSNNIQSDVDSSSSSSLSGSVSNVVQSDSISFVPFTLPELFDAEKVVTSIDRAFLPMSLNSANSAFNSSPYYKNYLNNLSANNYYLRIGGRLPDCIIFKFEFRGNVENLEMAKSNCSKFFDDNIESFYDKYEIIKKYCKDVASYQVAFEFVSHNDSWYSEIMN